ncbi:putative bifunctional diguanylate cyclase/phosphodiesterase [Glaciecola petra]|uniref:EAL domain-containing protein n=1 Tax=Glaciecola petra TaxID=3075602 RepID=A0ABU2ZRP0_9ALTE|nr:EAL domain-containing protein [Aestuariibacter sp. P117]MDT0595305.1 EAL domain-containing protein [Aestuariibacter sp. P117]
MINKDQSIWGSMGTTILTLNDLSSRVKQVSSIVYLFILLFIALASNAWIQNDTKWMIEGIAAAILLASFLSFLSNDTYNIVAGMTLWTVVIFTSSRAFYGDGLYDTVLLFYPCVLIFAAFFGGRAMIVPLSCYMVTSFYFFAYALSKNIIEPTIIANNSSWAKATEMSILLAVYGVGIVLITGYFKSLMRKLSESKKNYELVKQKAERLILFDDVTGLGNAEKCKIDLKKTLIEQRRDTSIIGFVTLHVNNISWINSSFGHSFGEQVLISLAERFKSLQDDFTSVYRTSGIEFTFVTHADDYTKLQDFCHQAIRLAIAPVSISEYDLESNCSLGVAVAPFDGKTYEALNRKSSFAVYKARRDEQNNCYFYESEMEASITRRINMNSDLRTAINESQFELYFQPIVELSNNRIVGAEALIRWKKDNTLIPPYEFIPVAEESGLIVEIGRWVLEKACTECAKWQALGLQGISVAVNLSPVQFKRGNLPNHVFRALQKNHLDPSLLELEITESLFIDDTETIEKQIHIMVQKGVYFAIDDFGTGYSNLNYLSKFNASTLKIDMSFVRHMKTTPQLEHIVNAIIKMSHAMDLENVAEGVEDAETAAALKEKGCAYGQGYYWSKPLPADDFVAFVQAHNKI